MAYEGFLSLGGVEIANAARVKAYADELVPLLGLSDCWGCTDLAEVLGDDEYTTPMIDRPDWLSDHDPDSWDFCGFYPLEIEGLEDGVREATVTELALDGAVVGAPRYRSREIRVSGLLIGVSDAAVSYGLTWLGKALEGSPCRGAEGCTGDHLCYYSACPPMCTDSPALDVLPQPDEPGLRHHASQFYLCDGGLITTAARACSVDYERTLYQVTMTSGPTVMERYNSHCGSMVRVEFTLVAGVPFAFSTAISAVPGLEPVPDPQVTPEVACTPGTDVVVRTNLATNPVPVGNAAGTGDGWQPDGSAFTAAVDEDIFRLEGGSSVRVNRNAVADAPNLAPNPQPTGTLDGWSWRLGQSNPGAAVRTNLVENPYPRLADGWTYNVPGGQAGTITRTNYARNPQPAGPATGAAVDGFGQYGTGIGETGVTMTSDVPLSSAVVRTNRVTNPSFETGTVGMVTGSTTVATSTFANGVRSGARCLLVTVGSAPSALTFVGQSVGAVTPGQWVAATIPARWSGYSGRFRVGIQFLDSSGAQTGSLTRSEYVTAPSGTYVLPSHSAQAPSAAVSARAFLYLAASDDDAPAAGAIAHSDEWIAAAAATQADAVAALTPWFDGSTPSRDTILSDRRYGHSWSGAQNGSTSVEYLTIPPGALSPEGTGFARRVITTAKTAGSTGWQARNPAYSAMYDGVEGDSVAVSMWMRYDGPTAQRVRLRIEFFDTTTVTTGDSGFFDLPAGEWVRVSHVLAATGGFTQVRWWAYQIGGGAADQTPQAGSIFDIANVLIEPGTTVSDYFDGDTADTDDAVYSWTGGQYASASIAQALDSEPFTAPLNINTTDPGPDAEPGYAFHTQGVGDDKAWNVTYTGTQVLADGVTHTVSVYFRSTSERQVQFAGRTFDVPGYGWVRLTGQVTGDGGPLTLTVSGVGQADGEQIAVARALVEATATLDDYFDGNTPDTDGLTFAWSGDEDASTSVGTLLPTEVTTTLATGTGPGTQTTFQRTTIVAPKAGGEDGPVYVMAAGEGLYTVAMQVRPSVGVRASLRVSALDASGTVLASTYSDLLTLPAGEWTRMTPVRIAAPVDTVRLQVAVMLPADVALPAGATFDAAAVQVVDGLFLTDPTIARATYLGQHVNTRTVIAVVGGGTYTASVYAGANVGSVATVSVAWYTSAGLPVGGLTRGLGVELDAWNVFPIGVAEWHRPYVTATAPSTARYAVVSIEVRKVASGVQVGDAAWLTSVLFEQSSALLSYFDGSLPDADNISYEWTGTAHASTSHTLLTIPEPAGPIVDPDCPVVPAPPRPPVINVSCVDTPTQWRRYVVSVAADLVPEWRDAVPIIRLQAGGTAVRQVRVRFYPNPLEAPLAALNPCDYCGEFVVTYIPARSLMTIDGIRQWVSVTDDQSGRVTTANHLLASSDGGPVDWPVLGCGVAYTLVVDVSPTAVADLEPQICLAARS